MRACGLFLLAGGLQPLLHHTRSARSNEVEPRAPVVTPRATRSRVGASHPLQYLRALQTWTETAHGRALAARSGRENALECPPPAPCKCHCDCVATNFEKPPPPVAPCPTFYPPYPTRPPEPPASTPYPGLPATTLPPMTTTTTTTTTTTFNGVPTCQWGEVMRSDGTCEKISQDTIRELKELVKLKKETLDAAERKYSGKDCCVSSEALMTASGNLLYAHDEYRKALDLLLAVMAMMGEETTTTTGTTTSITGTEFAPGSFPGRAHCEPWTTVNGTATAQADCASLCRHQPFCKAFGLDQASGQCVWFDYTLRGDDPMPACFTGVSNEFVKLENVTWGDPHKVFGAVEKVHTTSQLLDALLHKADATAAIANDTLTMWDLEANASVKVALKGTFIFAKKNYTESIGEAATVREERAAAVADALRRMALDEAEHPGLAEWTTTTTLPPITTTTTSEPTTTTTTTTTTTQPVVLTVWKDFPNAQDSTWAELHPQCPMGPPCFCDCKCHGLPPQSFVEPPPPLPQPCPGPGPMPDPSRYSLPLGAPSLDPRLMLPQDRGIR